MHSYIYTYLAGEDGLVCDGHFPAAAERHIHRLPLLHWVEHRARRGHLEKVGITGLLEGEGEADIELALVLELENQLLLTASQHALEVQPALSPCAVSQYSTRSVYSRVQICSLHTTLVTVALNIKKVYIFDRTHNTNFKTLKKMNKK